MNDLPSHDPNRCRVIGVLDDGVASLGATALAHLRAADVVIGGARTLALFRHTFKAGAVTHDLTFASAADRQIGIVDGRIDPHWRA